jgi:hypothetical protein
MSDKGATLAISDPQLNISFVRLTDINQGISLAINTLATELCQSRIHITSKNNIDQEIFCNSIDNAFIAASTGYSHQEYLSIIQPMYLIGNNIHYPLLAIPESIYNIIPPLPGIISPCK